MRLFIGLDVSLAKTAICVVSEHGKIVQEAQVASEPEALAGWIGDHDGSIAAIGLEAGPLSQWLHRRLSTAGLDVVLMETRQVKGVLKAMPIKTDRRDAEGIARLLHLGWFRPVHCKSVSAQEVRAVLGARKAIQQGMIALEMSLRGLLRNFGFKVGPISRGRFDFRIRELVEGNTMLGAATEPMLRARACSRQELAGLERRVRQLAQEDPVCRQLMSMPGIGAVVALTFRSAVDDPARFTSSKELGPWVGLTTSRNQSGERDVSGGVTKAGDVNQCRALCQAATVMMHRRRSTWLRTWATQVARRRGAKRAIDEGHDPLATQEDFREAPLVKDMITRHIAEHLPKLAKNNAADQTSMLRKMVEPAWGNKLVTEITKSDVAKFLDCVAEGRPRPSKEKPNNRARKLQGRKPTPIRANRMAEVLRKMFTLAMEWEWRTDNPAQGFHRRIEHARETFLSSYELSRLAKVLDSAEDQRAAAIIRLCMLTGTRVGEVRTAQFDQFSLDYAIWSKPASTTKQRKIHRVPISQDVAAIVRLRHQVVPRGNPGLPDAESALRFAVKRDQGNGCQHA